MPTFSRSGSKKGSDRAAQQSPPAALPAAKIKTPYWASTEVNPSAPTTTPAAPNIQRKPSGASANAGTQPQQSISPPARSVQRKPVPTSPSTQPTWRYNPVEGNPYRPGPRRDSIQYGLHLVQPETSTQPAPETNRRTYSPPHWASPEEAENLQDPRVAALCQSRINARNASEELERPLSPGSIFANGGVPAVPERKPLEASKVFSRGLGGVKKAAEQAKRALSVSHEPKISAPVPGSLARGGGRVMQQQEGVAPLNLVDLEVAQGDVLRFGRVDLQLANKEIVGPRAEAWALLTGEPIPAQSPRVPPAAASMPSVPAHPPRTSSRKPAPAATPRPRPAVPAPAPAHHAVPAATKSKQNPRKVLGEDGRETVFGDFVDLANDSSWVRKAEAHANNEAPYEGKGKGRAAPAPSKPSSAAQNGSSPPLAPKPLKVRKQPVVDKSLPPTPPEQLPTRHNTLQTLQDAALPAETQNSQPVTAPSLAAALAAEGIRPTSYVPGIKCSDCGKMIDAVSVGDHRCGRRAAQAVDHEVQPTGPSREEVYAANFRGGYSTVPAELVGQGGIYGFVDPDNEPNVVVDTFVHSGHTSWKGVVRAGDSVESLGGQLDGGAEGVRRSNEAERLEQANGWRNKTSGYG